MLKKLLAAANPFKNPPRQPAAAVCDNAAPTHGHSFSCPCDDCGDETARLTRERLKRQGA